MLGFNQWTGEHVLWQLNERDGSGKCDVISWPPLISGRWPPLRYHEFVFAGFTDLLSLDVLTGKLTVTECDDSAFIARCQGAALRCSPLFMHQLQLAQGHPQSGGHTLHQVVYLGSDLLLHYERNSGRYALLSFMRCRPADGSADSALTNATVDAPAPRCAISTTPLASGTLKPGAIHSYLGDGYLLAHFPHIEDAYELVRVVRPDDGRFYATSPPADDSAAHNQTRVAVGDDAKSFGASTSITSSSGRTLPAAAAGAYRLERESGGRLPVLGSFSHDGRRQRRLTSLHDGKLLDYDKEDGSYRLMRLRHQPGSSARFETLSSGTLPSGALSGCAAHTSSVACLRAGGAQCGWCQASGTCVRGDTWGPCQRVPCMQPSCGLWHSPVGTFMPSDSEPTQQRENATSPPAV